MGLPLLQDEGMPTWSHSRGVRERHRAALLYSTRSNPALSDTFKPRKYATLCFSKRIIQVSVVHFGAVSNRLLAKLHGLASRSWHEGGKTAQSLGRSIQLICPVNGTSDVFCRFPCLLNVPLDRHFTPIFDVGSRSPCSG